MAIDNIIQDSWQGHSHGEVEQALKAMLSQILQDIEDAGIPVGGITADMLATALKNAINNAVPNTRKVNNKALSGDITIGASDINVDSNTTLAQKLADMEEDIEIAGQGGGGGDVGLTEEDIDVSSNQDGTVDFTFGESSYTINLNHTHPQYVPAEDLEDYILAGTNVTISKDAQTGALTINASGGGGGGGITGITMNGSSVTVNNGVANLGTVITSHQSLSGRVQSADITTIVVCADETAYNSISPKDSNTLYLIKEGSNA